jgi:hypothetical protein
LQKILNINNNDICRNRKLDNATDVSIIYYVDFIYNYIMDILSFNREGIHSDTTERFYFYREAAVNNQFSGKHTIVLTKYSKQLPVRKDTYTPSPPYSYTFPHSSIPQPLPLPILPPPSY